RKHIGIGAAYALAQRNPVCPVPAGHLIQDAVAGCFERTARMEFAVDERERVYGSAQTSAQFGPIGPIPARDVAGRSSARRIEIASSKDLSAAGGNRAH